MPFRTYRDSSDDMANEVFFIMLLSVSCGTTTFLSSLNPGVGKFVSAQAINPVKRRSRADRASVLFVHLDIDLRAAQFTNNAKSFFTGTVEAPAVLTSLPPPRQ